MKKIFAIVLIFMTSILPAMAQCTFISPTVDIISTQTSGANCVINFNLSFDIITNSGNKVIFVHLWKLEDYPSLSYSSAPTAAQLSNTVLNIVIDNFGTPQLLSTYSPAPSIVVQNPLNNPGITLQKVASATAGADRFIISNVQVTTPGACASTFVFKGDAWSSNSNSATPSVQCSMLGFSIGLNDPLVSGFCVSPTPNAAYNFNISTTSEPLQMYYDVYMDNGNNIFDPASDILINSVPITSAITISPGNPFNSGTVNYPPAFNTLTYASRKLYVIVGVIGRSYLLSTEIAPCGVSIYNYGDLPYTGALSWPLARASVVGTYNTTTLKVDNSVTANTTAIWAGNAVGVMTEPFTACIDGKNPAAQCDATDDGLGIPAVAVGGGGTYPFTVTVNGNLAGLTAYYGLWFDWNNDGNFTDDHDLFGNPAFYSGNTTTQSPRTLPVNVSIPTGFSTSYKVRLIVSASPVTSGMYNTTSLVNGEVEDYFAPVYVALPLTFTDFTAEARQCSNYLTFKAENEQNNHFFRIEQSNNGSDWHVIAIIESKGTGTNEYQFMDTKPAAGKNYYRIQQVDNNALYTYSKTLDIDNPCAGAGNAVAVYPNPSENDINLSLPYNMQHSDITLFNMLGEVVYQAKSTGESKLVIHSPGIPAGIYLLKIADGNNVLYTGRITRD